MTVSRHVEEAAGKLQEAARQIALAREGPNSCENQRVWLEGLTTYCEALADLLWARRILSGSGSSQ